MKKQLRRRWIGVLLNAVPISGIVYLGYELLVGTDNIDLLRLSGEYAMWTLILTLACTPLNTVFGWKGSLKYKKAFGIYAFLFLAIHLAVFVKKHHWQVASAVIDVLGELNLILGAVSFVFMLLLFLTSNRTSMRRLKKSWKSLHRLVYPTSVLASGHILLISDSFNPHGIKYALLTILMLLIRVSPVKQYFIKRRKNRVQAEELRSAGRRKSVKPVFLLLVVVTGAPILINSIWIQPISAGEKYRYDKDSGFFSMLFADDALPVVNHTLTRKTCGNECHAARQPGLLPKRSWKKIMASLEDHFGEKVFVSPIDRQQIETYLVENSADYTYSKQSIKVMHSSSNWTPVRITEIPFFIEEHDHIPESVIRHDSIKSLSNCLACHIGSDKTGTYKKRDIQIPEH